MKFQLLGSLRVMDGDEVVSINATKVKILLATLLIRANQIVPFDQIVTELWGEDPPRRASAAVFVYVSQLRKFLRQSGGSAGPVITRAPGYLIQTGPDDLDLNLFLRLIEQARKNRRENLHHEVAELAHKGLGLWREPVLADLRESPSVTRFAAWLEELRIEFIEMLVDSYLALGRERESVGYLYALLQEYPLHENFYRQLMIALHNGGRAGEALQVYRSARETLLNEIGLEPGRALQNLQQDILRADDLRRPRLTVTRGR
ncbi:AfsR/SARP family transcriptional regulator [Symbioplanes lichenis]|uniref:AfsR/SARP family transcriptional regulator n=1 Tax=Symbioplanes lichenis TaxID=1629072 RepID=UPI002739274D|nr:AfsR/SARP family transcriptional regulator [Actinoplanes lichenis]